MEHGTSAGAPVYARLSESPLPVLETIRIDLAEPEEYDAIAALLSQAGLSSLGLFEKGDPIYVAWDGDRIVGCAAVEVYGRDGLLRSVATADAVRGTGLGGRLVGRIEQAGYEIGITRLYLLTETAEGFFAHLGYEPVGRADMPDLVRSSTQFTSLCPATAVAMARNLKLS